MEIVHSDEDEGKLTFLRYTLFFTLHCPLQLFHFSIFHPLLPRQESEPGPEQFA